MTENKETSLIVPVTTGFIERRIKLVRGQKVLLSTDLAELYQVKPSVLIQAVKRNINRFPKDFMFQISLNEAVSLKSQFVISNGGRGGRRHQPYAFTELGVAMLSSVLNSERAVQMNIFIMRAFVALRQLLDTHAELAKKIEELERGQNKLAGHVVAVSTVLDRLVHIAENPRDAMGFQV